MFYYQWPLTLYIQKAGRVRSSIVHTELIAIRSLWALWMYAWHTKSAALDLWPPEQDSCSGSPPNVVHTISSDTITCSWINLILFVLQLCSLIPRPFNSLGIRLQFVLIAIHKAILSMQTTPESEAADVLTTSECHNNNWRRHIYLPATERISSYDHIC